MPAVLGRGNIWLLEYLATASLHMDVYPPGGEDIGLPARRVFCVLFGHVNLCHGLATSVVVKNHGRRH